MTEHHHHQFQPIQSSIREGSTNNKTKDELRSTITTASTTDDYTDIDEEVDFGRYTVPQQLLTFEQYRRCEMNTYAATNDDLDLDCQPHHNTLEEFEKIFIDLPWNNKDSSKEELQELKSTDDPILYETMNQLATSTTNDKQSFMKDIQTEIDKTPNYLAKQNKSFQQMINHVRSTTATTTTATIINKDGLRKTAILIYKIMVIQTYHLLWTAYLKSGLGQLMIPSTEQPSYLTAIPIWPKEIKALLQLTTNTNTTKANEIYLKFVNKHLHELDYQLKKYQTELNIETNNFHGYTLAIQQITETYIEQNLQPFRMKIEHQIELLHYDYQIRSLKLEYFRHKPNTDQIQMMKKMCQSQYEQETTEQEYNFLKQQITYYSSPKQSLECCSSLAQSVLKAIDSLPNIDIRQQIFYQYKQIVTQSKTDLFQLYMKSAVDERQEYKKKYEDIIKQMQSHQQQSIDENKIIPSIMIQLINQRCEKISELIKYLYKFKVQSILS